MPEEPAKNPPPMGACAACDNSVSTPDAGVDAPSGKDDPSEAANGHDPPKKGHDHGQ